MRTSSFIPGVVKYKEYASIKELCRQSPVLVINTPCGVGRYRFDMLTYDNKDRLILKYRLIKDKKFKDTDRIEYVLGKFEYLSAKQFLYAFKHYANS